MLWYDEAFRDDIAKNIYDDAFEYTSTYWDDFRNGKKAEDEQKKQARRRSKQSHGAAWFIYTVQ